MSLGSTGLRGAGPENKHPRRGRWRRTAEGPGFADKSVGGGEGTAPCFLLCCCLGTDITQQLAEGADNVNCLQTGQGRGKGLTDSQSQCPRPLPLPCRPHTRLTDPVGEGREPLSSGPLLRPQRTTPHPNHPARSLGFSFPKSRTELTASEGSLRDAGGDRWTEPTTPASPGDT